MTSSSSSSSRGRSSGRRRTQDALREVLAEIENDPPPRAGPADDGPPEEDPTEGEWLYKEDDVLKGPVPADLLVEGIADGTLGRNTPIAREIGQWRFLSELPYFAEHIEAAEERARAEEEARQAKARKRKRTGIRGTVLLVLILVPGLVGAVLGRGLMAWRPWDTTMSWLDRAPGLAQLPPKQLAFTKRTEELKKKKKKKRAAGKKAGDGEWVRPKSDLPRLTRSLKQGEVMAGLKSAKKGLGRCLKAEFKRNPKMPGTVTLAFSVHEDGHAINIKLLERQVRDGPLAGCIRGVVEKLGWQKFTGERPYAEVPFNIKR